MASKNMKDISNLLKNLKFRKKMFGGIDEKDVWRKLDELQEEYQNVYDAKGTAKEAEDIDDPEEVIKNKRKKLFQKEEIIIFFERLVFLAALVVFMFGTSVRQKNELGTVMGFGCGMIILLNVFLNFAGIFGWIPLTTTFLPFLSVGRNNILLSYALVGIILSIYRYKDVYPKKFKASQVSLQKTITLNLNM